MKKGFSLMEILIVVAIIGVLVAIGIPVFASQLSERRKEVCAYNRRALQTIISLEILTNHDVTLEELNQLLEEQDAHCPGSGAYSVKKSGDGYLVVCNVHPDVDGAVISNQFGLGVDELLKENAAFKSKWESTSSNTRIDSGGKNWSPTVLDGMPLFKQLGVKSWAILNNKVISASDQAANPGIQPAGVEYVWSTYDVSDGSYARVPAISYNVTTGKYSVSMSNVSQLKGKTSPDNVEYTYYVIASSAETKGFNYKGKKDYTYEEALALYNTMTPVNR